MPASAISSARGTVRSGRSTSPDSDNAVSAPENANINTSIVRPSTSSVGDVGIRRQSQVISDAPTTTNRRSGASLATVRPSTTVAPCRTPRMLMAAMIPIAVVISAARPMPLTAQGR